MAGSEIHRTHEFIGIDGEGFNVKDRHEYTLLAASSGEFIKSLKGLRSVPCLEFLLELGRRHPGATFVSFGFSYDVNMMLSTVHPKAIRYLSHNKRTFLHDAKNKDYCYKIEYIPRKLFILSQYKILGKGKIKLLSRIPIYDVQGFFQCSFVKALTDYDIGTKLMRNHMSKMKDIRGNFKARDFSKIQEYNKQECECLVLLMDKLKTQLDFLGVPLTRWHGSGAIANQILKSFGIKKHIARPEEGTKFETAVMSAYFGGRIQSLQIGQYENVHAYDIVSAYPFALRDLPSLSDCEVIPVRCFMGFGVYRVQWCVPTDFITPFPWRDSHGCINYPQSGEGWYWASEVEVALELFPGQVKVKEGFVIRTLPYERPCAFIQHFFDLRAKLKEQKHPAQKAVKLCLNSLYGKFAQGFGMSGRPAYQCYIYAGLTTSICRAQMLMAAMQQPQNVIAFATDSITCTKPLHLPETKELGSWESRFYDKGFFLKPGFYRLSDKKENTDKVRGFPPASIDFQLIEDEFARVGVNGKLLFYCRKFVTMKQASKNLPWRTWLDQPRKLNFWPTHGDPDLLSTRPMRYRLTPPLTCEGLSKIFVPKAEKPDPELDIEGETVYTMNGREASGAGKGRPLLPWTVPGEGRK